MMSLTSKTIALLVGAVGLSAVPHNHVNGYIEQPDLLQAQSNYMRQVLIRDPNLEIFSPDPLPSNNYPSDREAPEEVLLKLRAYGNRNKPVERPTGW